MSGVPQHRYTLTEGDFHHLKNARLTHLHLPPLKIATIHECDPGEASSVATPHPATTPKGSLAIFQVRVSAVTSPGPRQSGGGYQVESWPAGVGKWDLPLTYLSSFNPSISQPPGKALTGHSVGPSSALPGDPYNSVDFSEISPPASSDSGEGTSVRRVPCKSQADGKGAQLLSSPGKRTTQGPGGRSRPERGS